MRTLPILAALALAASAPSRAGAADFETCWKAYEGSKWAEAATCFDALAKEYPDWAWVHHYLGVSYHGQGKADQAIASLQKAMDLMPNDAEPGFDPFFMAATVLEAKGEHRKALDALERGQGWMTPEQKGEYHALRGRLEYQLGQHARAAEDLRKSGKKDFATTYALGLAAYHAEDFVTATEALESAVKQKPEDSAATNLLSLAFYRRAEVTPDKAARDKLYARAAEVGKAMLAKNPTSVEAHNLIGRSLLGAGDLDGAEREFREVLRLKPDHCYAHANLAQAAMARKQPDKAIESGTKALACLPADAKRDVHATLGFAHSAKGKALGDAAGETDVEARRDAIAQYRKAQEQFRAADALRSSAQVKTQIDVCAAAIRGFEEAIATIEQNKAALDANAAAEEEERKARERREALEKARRGQP